MKLLKKKETLILTAALIIPGGLVALGLWKAYELYNKEKKDEKRTSESKQQPLLDRLGIDPNEFDAGSESN